MEVIFEIRVAEEGGYRARALGYAIFTEGETWEELRNNVLEAVSLHFEDDVTRPRIVQLHYVKDELQRSITIESLFDTAYINRSASHGRELIQQRLVH